MRLFRQRKAELALILAGVALVAAAGLAGRQAKQQEEITRAGAHADEQIVRTGRLAIKSGCTFDNKRAHALRVILRRSIASQRRLYRRGLLTRDDYLRGRREGRRAVREIVVRDCAAAGRVFDR